MIKPLYSCEECGKIKIFGNFHKMGNKKVCEDCKNKNSINDMHESNYYDFLVSRIKHRDYLSLEEEFKKVKKKLDNPKKISDDRYINSKHRYIDKFGEAPDKMIVSSNIFHELTSKKEDLGDFVWLDHNDNFKIESTKIEEDDSIVGWYFTKDEKEEDNMKLEDMKLKDVSKKTLKNYLEKQEEEEEEYVEIPDNINLNCNGYILSNNRKRSLEWNYLAKDWISVPYRNKKKKYLDRFLLVPCEREEINPGQTAFRCHIEDPDFDCLLNYCMILDDERYVYMSGGSVMVNSDSWEYWWKLVRRKQVEK